jgi:hypothetical protein
MDSVAGSLTGFSSVGAAGQQVSAVCLENPNWTGGTASQAAEKRMNRTEEKGRMYLRA